MEWVTCLRSAIEYMEEHLLDDIGAEKTAEQVHISPIYLQKGFQIMTGYSMGEYLRNRRLYKAAVELTQGDEKIIDIALKYGYETPESFTKAFSRFHGMNPTEARKNPMFIKTFHPLRINIVIQGGESMDFVLEKMAGFKVIGFVREFSFENSYEESPKFWDEICAEYMSRLYRGIKPSTPQEQAVFMNRIGEFGVCIDDIGKDGKFSYMIAGRYMGGDVPEGMKVYEFEDMDWAKFKCVGPMPQALQNVNTQIFKEWLPGNPDYEIAGKYNIEWYSGAGSTQDADYQSAIWIPVKKK